MAITADPISLAVLAVNTLVGAVLVVSAYGLKDRVLGWISWLGGAIVGGFVGWVVVPEFMAVPPTAGERLIVAGAAVLIGTVLGRILIPLAARFAVSIAAFVFATLAVIVLTAGESLLRQFYNPRASGLDAVAVTDHLFRYSPGSTDRAVVPVVLTKAATVQSVSGGTKRVVTERAGDASVVRSGSPVTVEFEMTWSGSSLPNRADVWQRSLNEEIPASAVPTGSTACESDTSTTDPDIVCEFETDTLVVSVVEIDYEFE